MSPILKQAQALLLAGDYSTAEALSRRALAFPHDAARAKKLLAESLYNQGVSLLVYGEMVDAAEQTFLAALEYNAKYAPALHNLGAIQDQQGNTDTAIGFYLRALAADERYIPSLQNLATAYQRTDNIAEAAVIFEKLARLDPKNAGLYKLRNALLIRSIIPDSGYPQEVRKRMEASLDNILANRLNGQVPERHAAPYFYLSYHGLLNTNLHRKIAQTYLHVCPGLAWTSPQIGEQKPPGNRIRIGIASANLRNHSIGHTTRGLVEKLDRTKFEVVLVRLGRPPQDAMVAAIDNAADEIALIAATDLARAREQISALKLDLLFYQDIGMEPFSYLLSFSRLAPVQLTSFGHPDTTGVPNLDYFISSELYEAGIAEEHYSEKLVLLPEAGTLSYYYKPEKPPEAVARQEFGLDGDSHLYFCPQTLFKIHPDMDDVFFAILDRDPAARIVLIEPSQAHMRQALEKRWRARGNCNTDRIMFIKRLLHADYLRLMSCVDVMLDTVHFNGQNTNLEAFALGIPVVTWPGSMQRARHTVGMYKAMGEKRFSSLIAYSPEDYAEKAVKIACDSSLRADLQALIVRHADILYENTDFIRSCEQAFIKMHSQAQKTLTAHSARASAG